MPPLVDVGAVGDKAYISGPKYEDYLSYKVTQNLILSPRDN
jgi:hypothetical protein